MPPHLLRHPFISHLRESIRMIHSDINFNSLYWNFPLTSSHYSFKPFRNSDICLLLPFHWIVNISFSFSYSQETSVYNIPKSSLLTSRHMPFLFVFKEASMIKTHLTLNSSNPNPMLTINRIKKKLQEWLTLLSFLYWHHWL